MNYIVGDKFYWQYIYLNQWRSKNAEKVTHIKGRLLEQAVILLIVSLFIIGTSLKGEKCSHREQILSIKSSSYWYGKSLLPH